MSRSTPSPPSPPEGNLAEEMARIPYEPLLPVEKKLIAWSLILGIALLGLLFWISSSYFSVSAG
jgi:hypothetical protein